MTGNSEHGSPRATSAPHIEKVFLHLPQVAPRNTVFRLQQKC